MDLGELIPIVAIVCTALVILSVIRFKRDRLRGGEEHEAGAAPSIAKAEENARLAHENEALRLTVRRLEERMAVLETIATDPAERTAREIEQLR